jgi:hypothetical protein
MLTTPDVAKQCNRIAVHSNAVEPKTLFDLTWTPSSSTGDCDLRLDPAMIMIRAVEVGCNLTTTSDVRIASDKIHDRTDSTRFAVLPALHQAARPQGQRRPPSLLLSLLHGVGLKARGISAGMT